jgi:hypothetical protein
VLGRLRDLRGIAVGSVIQVLVSHDDGDLTFRVDDETMVVTLSFPALRRAALRPFVALGAVDDRVSFVTPFVTCGAGLSPGVCASGDGVTCQRTIRQ